MSVAFIGTSGWMYKGWRESFFPSGLKDSRLLGYYQQHFNSVEVNSTFYRLPRSQTVTGWREKAPQGFRYVFKVSRYLSHTKKLLDPQEPVARFMNLHSLLGEKAGPVLLQLPPSLVPSADRLGRVLEEFRRNVPHIQLAVEFRNRLCYDDPLIDLLDDHRASMVIHDMEGSGVSACNPEAPFVYIRYHGAEGRKYAGNYDDARLRADARRIDSWLSEGRDVYAFFNNDAENHAPWNAITLKGIL